MCPILFQDAGSVRAKLPASFTIMLQLMKKARPAVTRPAFSDEETLKTSQFLANFWLLATMAYLKQREQSIADWVYYGGEHVVRGFRTRRNMSALELARTVALNTVSLGGTLVRLEGHEKCANVTVHFPAEEMVNAFGLSLDEFDLFLGNAYKPLATYLDLKYTSRRNGEIWTWQISR